MSSGKSAQRRQQSDSAPTAGSSTNVSTANPIPPANQAPANIGDMANQPASVVIPQIMALTSLPVIVTGGVLSLSKMTAEEQKKEDELRLQAEQLKNAQTARQTETLNAVRKFFDDVRIAAGCQNAQELVVMVGQWADGTLGQPPAAVKTSNRTGRAKSQETRDAVLAALKSKGTTGKTNAEIAEANGVSVPFITGFKKAMIKEGKLPKDA